ncbi:NADH:ubiquinone reductase (Na(+)-transporting) subunit C [Marinilongibacter aquaticus]|uniref:NADH:ubiquinone reductase (Na(+)-transporting) subunit C n=1 Tax=Marinilongibacter aquaticus TaxID=2975157 RepID=UPI0021BD8CD2|nr:NADH:ubiquinone reductase (Na(+)-transporting) subunit C [Marinilongibacter aquaticus]UBM57957.1 NADH:ubiquinone reductase (Na(+)-transporting) subunit C [Marinilongibacter aquaticus]
MHNNRYTFLYAIAISVVTAVILALTSEGLRPRQEANVALDNKKNILKSVLFDSESRQEVESKYNSDVKELVLNSKGEVLEGIKPSTLNLKREVNKPVDERKMPLYEYTGENGQKAYVIPVYGVGLWGPIWGFISLQDDFNTVKGAFFDHKGETPGLGAEIAEAPFQRQFQGKKILDENGGFISINVLKTTMKSDVPQASRVDAISGGTITSTGVDNMIKNCMEPYLLYFEKLKTN